MQLPYRRLLTGVRVFDIPPCSVLSSRITDRPTRDTRAHNKDPGRSACILYDRTGSINACTI